ncbi:MAG: hypothetical protein SPH70_02845 [Candidatus Cryptobacteroides sp.]|nr:hypothetical protein [Bacteroidales bacterium]MDY6157999.1 hypothetical protein [Candidatus Cryptobacteroides sp.]
MMRLYETSQETITDKERSNQAMYATMQRQIPTGILRRENR